MRTPYRISRWVLYVLLAVIGVTMGLFVFGGGVPVAASGLWQPAFLDGLLVLVYVLLALALLVSLLAVLGRWRHGGRAVAGWRIGIAGFLLLLLLVAWLAGAATPLEIRGYTGADNVASWLKVADMFLYSIYVLMAVAIVLAIMGNVHKLRKK